MAVERRNPLPVGRYWVDILDPPKSTTSHILLFDAWLAGNRDKVALRRKEERGTTLWSLDYSGVRDNWYLFDVLEPVEWPRDRGFGFPTIAQSPTAPKAPKVETSADTVQRPPEPSISDDFSRLFDDIKTGAVALVILWALLKGK